MELKPFNKEFIQPLLAQIDSDLKDKKDVSDFKNIETLLDSAFFENKTRIKLIRDISRNLLAKGQTILENTLGLHLLSKLPVKTDISEFKKLVAENSDRSKLPEECNEIISELKLLEEDEEIENDEEKRDEPVE